MTITCLGYIYTVFINIQHPNCLYFWNPLDIDHLLNPPPGILKNFLGDSIKIVSYIYNSYFLIELNFYCNFRYLVHVPTLERLVMMIQMALIWLIELYLIISEHYPSLCQMVEDQIMLVEGMFVMFYEMIIFMINSSQKICQEVKVFQFPVHWL